MAVKVGDKYLCNIPEAVSQLIEDVEALKDQTAGTEANVYKLIEGQAFDEDLFNKMKVGDIVIVNNLPFVITKTANKIEGNYFNGFGGAIIYGSFLKIEWERNDILKFNTETKYVKDLSFIQADIKAKSLEAIDNLKVGGYVDGNLPVAGAITGDSIIENMSGYSFQLLTHSIDIDIKYAGACKNGNKLTLVISGIMNRPTGSEASFTNIGKFIIPTEIADKLIPISSSMVDNKLIQGFSLAYRTVNLYFFTNKEPDKSLNIGSYGISNLTADTDYVFRYEVTFLLGENLVPSEE